MTDLIGAENFVALSLAPMHAGIRPNASLCAQTTTLIGPSICYKPRVIRVTLLGAIGPWDCSEEYV